MSQPCQLLGLYIRQAIWLSSSRSVCELNYTLSHIRKWLKWHTFKKRFHEIILEVFYTVLMTHTDTQNLTPPDCLGDAEEVTPQVESPHNETKLTWEPSSIFLFFSINFIETNIKLCSKWLTIHPVYTQCQSDNDDENSLISLTAFWLVRNL